MIRRLAAQALLAVILAVPHRGLVTRGVLRGLGVLRNLLAALGDPLVIYELAGSRILLPLSHDLPITKKALPEYSTNVARVARSVAEKYRDLAFVDIGANVGDTAAVVRSEVDVPILSIEGDERFFAILERNALSIGGHIELERAFIGSASGAMQARVEEAKGSAHLVTDSEAPGVETLRLAEVLEKHPAFAMTKMIKIDTDGYDFQIIRGALELLAQLKSVLFFEYDPYWLGLAGDGGIDIFAELRKAGYEWAMFFEGIGEYLLSIRLDQQAALEDLDAYYRGRGGLKYADVCVFHRDDTDVWETVRRGELELFAQRRGNGNA